MKRYMAIDQYGNMHHDIKHPRKELLELYGVNHTSKMYCDDSHGVSWHIGYIIKPPGSYWAGVELCFTIYEVKPWRKLP